MFSIMEVEHLLRDGLDHAPLLLTIDTVKEYFVKHFRFLNFWVKEESFREVFQRNWKADFEGNSFILFHHKMKKVKKGLAQWSKDTFGNIFQEIITLEEVNKELEANFEADPSESNRAALHKAQAEVRQ